MRRWRWASCPRSTATTGARCAAFSRTTAATRTATTRSKGARSRLSAALRCGSVPPLPCPVLNALFLWALSATLAHQDGCDGAECRSLQYGVAGCSGPGTTPAPTPSPACDQPKLTNELCGQYCYDWLNELSDEIWAGTNNGECYCDTECDPGGEANGQCEAECPESDTGCDLPCNGEPSEMCGGAWFNQIVKVSCGGWSWAWPFVYGLGGLSIGYLVLGTAFNMSSGNAGLPNAGFWRGLGGLVNDVRLFPLPPSPTPCAVALLFNTLAVLCLTRVCARDVCRDWRLRWATSPVRLCRTHPYQHKMPSYPSSRLFHSKSCSPWRSRLWRTHRSRREGKGRRSHEHQARNREERW